MVSDVSESLHTFFVPQMEQLGLQEQQSKHGALCTLNNELGTGVLWAHSITENCLFAFHEIHPRTTIELVEFPTEYICITSMTDCSAKFCPISPRYLRERNTISFHQQGGSVEFSLKPGETHKSYTLCMTPEFFDKLEGVSDAEKDMLVSYLCSCDTNAHSREIRCALESLNPSWAMRAGGNLFCDAKLREILACALDDASKTAETDPWDDQSEERRLAREAQMMIDRRFGENLTLQSIASELFVGKTRLCAAFRNQIGSCVAEYLRSRRMAQARLLLETTDAQISEIGHAVGYAHQSSFTDAFRREFGVSPSQWRAKAAFPAQSALISEQHPSS